ncbi:hypothetical protein PAXINDRAFT_15139 [Paxillus involutus ATCC 200175]|uniref:Peptidase C14 caspase domain-containing protein n=1 Tax=Paxillus involutus ATCC 200175 TaxID=664439 RepID=A0A0C9TX90_PAXIN|nr:hypothetical protein PAXINDRAFT_15139 [Paxillus involutus ATCC 200175]
MVSRLPVGCRLTAIFDSCHSGSALDLPYIYSTEGKIKEPNVAMGAAKGLMSTLTSLQRNNVGGVISGVTDLVKVASGNAQKADQRTKATRTSLADVISWSGCKDSQTSADALIGGRNTGAMSDAFLKALEQNPNPTYQELLVGIRSKLSTKYMQKPQLSSSHPIDTHSMKFII